MTPFEILPFFLMIFAVGAVIGWMFGHNHGLEIGELKGAAEEHRNSLAKIIRHRKDAYKLGGVVMLSRLMRGQEPYPRPLKSREIQNLRQNLDSLIESIKEN